ncbi:GMC family oxidoreductase N-terminal domain-containing protein [Streptomyces natalensis]|uniref:GMC family oxidoreductase N-terminal domain-containing protein n=1 Tax=Streptomyces natalensis TaxID=68242 RepID=UPI0018E32D51|nr:GMC family oxidoreductase [Streptomyces natalensis]
MGSGFGGSVAALRLAEKGYRVTVVEAGRRWRPEDFATSPWQAHRLLWAPWLGWHGIARLRVRRRLAALMGVGVGGGSLVYAGVHYRPDGAVFREASWDPSLDWEQELAPYYALAERILGTTLVPRQAAGDDALREVATALGVPGGVHATRVGIHFGPTGRTVPDPFFDGRGPARAGCTECGRCTLGCRVGAKNSLDHNYLHLAQRAGADIRPLAEARRLIPQPDGTWQVHTRHGTGITRSHTVLTAHQVVLAAGAWGTAELLHRSRPYLPHLSPALGTRTRTNREVFAAASTDSFDVGPGVAISSALRPRPDLLVQLCRLGPGTHPAALLARPGGLSWRDFGRRTAILFAMEQGDSHLTSRYRHGRLTFRPGSPQPEPVRLAAAEAVAHHYARRIGGRSTLLWNTALQLPVTAHLMGGCPIGSHPVTSVADLYHRVHGYPTLHVIDASAVPGNLGVNPALTVTALAERACAAWPASGRPDQRPAQGEPYQHVPDPTTEAAP